MLLSLVLRACDTHGKVAEQHVHPWSKMSPAAQVTDCSAAGDACRSLNLRGHNRESETAGGIICSAPVPDYLTPEHTLCLSPWAKFPLTAPGSGPEAFAFSPNLLKPQVEH